MPTGVEWADETRNPAVGCARKKISPGCDRCYAEAQARRGLVPAHAEAITDGRWNGRMVWQDGQIEKFARWRKPRRIFMGSMGDLGLIRREWFRRIWEACEASPQHSYMFLTKRPDLFAHLVADVLDGEPPPWFWLGVTAEDQERADERIQLLLQTPAAVRFVSMEPMLGPVDVRPWLSAPFPSPPYADCDRPGDIYSLQHAIDWVICGAETGPGARPMDLLWASGLLAQCRAARVPFFFKSAGPRAETPPYLEVREWPEVNRGQ